MTATASIDHATATSQALSGGHAAKLAGVAFAALLPALFWTALIAAAANLLGYAVPAEALLATGAGIATFLAAVCAPLMLRSA